MAKKRVDQPTKEDSAADVAEAELPPIEPREHLNPKVKNAGEGGAVTIILVFLLQQLFPEVEIPAEVASAFTFVVSSILGYWTPGD